jgi:pimeloyl-ACP methyl ester carboxylesterase
MVGHFSVLIDIRQATLLRKFLTQKGLESPVMVGHSYGGGVCLALMRDQEQKASGLVLVGSMCYPQRFPFFIRALRSRFLLFIAFHVVPARMSVTSLLKQVYYQPDRIKPETIDEYVDRVKSDGARNAMVRTAESIIPPDIDEFTDSYRKISVPTLIIWGEHDRIVPISLGERLSTEIPTATFKMIADCGHAPQEELPEETVAIIAEFLKQPL